MPRKAAPPADGVEAPPPRRSGRIASTAATVKEVVKETKAKVTGKTAPTKKRAAEEGEGATDKKKAKTTEKEAAEGEMTEDVAPGEDADPVTAKLPPIEIGDALPSFVLKNEKDEDVDVSTLAQEKGVVFFLVPKADTPGCTTQACGFRDIYPDFTAVGYAVYCLSADTPAAQAKWQTKRTLPYPLLSDRKRVLIGALGAADGAKTKRSHFIFEKGGKLVDKKLPVKPADSPKLALEFIKSYSS